ncbi:MAG: hypothetical protein MI923_30175, partial [Phycisphaerales bacterium]|nr:hypothetical protein [Phycisphaerales bacterium]
QSMETDSPSNPPRISFELTTETLDIDAGELEKIKLAVLRFFGLPDSEFPATYLELRDYFREELESSACWISEEAAWVGGWKLESRDGQLALVKYPAPNDRRIYIFRAMLDSIGGEWKVVSFERERELREN